MADRPDSGRLSASPRTRGEHQTLGQQRVHLILGVPAVGIRLVREASSILTRIPSTAGARKLIEPLSDADLRRLLGTAGE